MDRMARFIEKTGGQTALPDAPDEEEKMTYELFIEDLDNLKKIFTRALRDALKGEEAVVKEFAEERAWLRDELEWYK
jgi:hypothetical protein